MEESKQEPRKEQQTYNDKQHTMMIVPRYKLHFLTFGYNLEVWMEKRAREETTCYAKLDKSSSSLQSGLNLPLAGRLRELSETEWEPLSISCIMKL